MSEKKQIVEEMARHIPAKIFVYDVSENTENLDEQHREIVALHLYRAGYRKQSGWISAENPPDEYRDEYGELIPFLVCCQGTVYPFRAMYDGTNWGDGIGVLKVTHWMPLPEPPQMKGGE